MNTSVGRFRPSLTLGLGALAVVVLAIAALVTPASAAIYKWVDEKGNTHFSQTPPPAKQGKKASKVKIPGVKDDGDAFQLPPDMLADYCTDIKDLAFKVAGKMRTGASADSALTHSHSDEGEVLAKQIIGYVYGFKNSDATPVQISGLVRKQCMNGAYTAHVENYLHRKYPDGIPEGIAKPSKGTETAGKSGTAWPVSHGFVITNNHVVSGSEKLTLIRADGTRINARVAARDKDNDLALLTVDNAQSLPPALPLRTLPASLGSEVFTIGFPHLDLMGRSPKVTEGIVSSETGLHDDDRYYQISVPVQAGNSGGPLIDMQGRVIGVVTGKLNALAVFQRSGNMPENVNYAIKSKLITDLLGNTTGSSKPRGSMQPTGTTLAELTAEIKGSVMIVLAQ
jgi:S1-C subfamily serine protease